MIMYISVRNRMGASQINDQYYKCFQKLLKLPESRNHEGNFRNYWKYKWY